jgi:uncharacterized protein YraI
VRRTLAAALLAVLPLSLVRVPSVLADDAGNCPAIWVYFSRGSDEPYGRDSMGGPGRRLLQGLESLANARGFGKVTGYGNYYQATPWTRWVEKFGFGSASYKTSVAEGISFAVADLNARSLACPGSRFVIAGYSQGADLTGGLFEDPRLSGRARAQVAAVVLFGDPRFNPWQPGTTRGTHRTVEGVLGPRLWPEHIWPRLVSYCRAADLVCNRTLPGDVTLHAHKRYHEDDMAGEAAKEVERLLSPPYVRYHVKADSAALRSGPGSNYPLLQTVGRGTPLDVACQARGTPHAGSTMWNRLTGGQWVHDALTTTPNYNNWSAPYRWCGSSTAPAPPPAPPSTVPSVRYRIVTDTATIRTGPSTQYPSVTVLGRGAYVDVVCQTRGSAYAGSTMWNQLVSGHWVHDVLTNSPNYNHPSPPYRWCAGTPPPPPPPPPPPSDVQFVTYAIATGTANLRTGPGTNYPLTGTLYRGATINVVCQGRGTLYGGSSVWNRLHSGDWVHDALTTTPNFDALSSPYRWCPAEPPPPPPPVRDMGRDVYWVWRGSSEARNHTVDHAAQSFVATMPKITTVSFNVGNATAHGRVQVAIATNAEQTAWVPGSGRTVTVNDYGETAVNYDPPLDVTVGQTYYLQLIHPQDEYGTFVVYRSAFDDYSGGAAQIGWGTFSSTDLNSHITGTRPDRDTYWVWQGGAEARNVTVPQAAQSFVATMPLLQSLSFNVGGSTTGGRLAVNVYSNAAQTSEVPGAGRTVQVNDFGETTVVFSPPLKLQVGRTYYLQLIHPLGEYGTFVVYRSRYDEYPGGAAQLNWSAFEHTDLNAHLVGVRAPSEVRLQRSTSSLTYGNAVTLDVSVRRRDVVTGLPGQPVRVYTRARGSTTWRLLGRVVTDAAGRARLSHRPRANVEYTARFAGNALQSSAGSPTVGVGVAPKMSASLSKTRMKLGDAATARLTVRPSHSGQLVYLQRRMSGQWKTVVSRRLTSTGTAAVVIRPTARGSRYYRFYKPGDGDHLAAKTATLTLTVV